VNLYLAELRIAFSLDWLVVHVSKFRIESTECNANPECNNGIEMER